MNTEFIEALHLLEKERGIDSEVLIKAIEDALVAAYKREFLIRDRARDKASDALEEGATPGAEKAFNADADTEKPASEGQEDGENKEALEDDGIRAHIDRETGEMTVYQPITVVEEVKDSVSEISLEQAKALSPTLEVGDQLVKEVDPAEFGRLASQTAKSVINQKLLAVEKERIHSEFESRLGDICSGVVQRRDRNEVIVDIGKAEAVLPRREQSKRDIYEFNQRMRFYILEVVEKKGAPEIHVSRSRPEFVSKLFEKEVPEIAEGVVEIVGVSREAGSRTKIAVRSYDENIDPLGSCVGQRGTRVQAVIDELRGEKIDIVCYDPNPEVFISNALSPARVMRVMINEDERAALVVVSDQQLSLAIGKDGQNVRLAARLTGWKIDIKSDSQVRAFMEKAFMSDFDEAVAADEASRQTASSAAMPSAETASDETASAAAAADLETSKTDKESADD